MKYSLILTLSLFGALLLGGCSDGDFIGGQDSGSPQSTQTETEERPEELPAGVLDTSPTPGVRQVPGFPNVPVLETDSSSSDNDNALSNDSAAETTHTNSNQEDTPDTTIPKDTDSSSAAGGVGGSGGASDALASGGYGGLFGGSGGTGGIIDVITSFGGMLNGVGGAFDWLDGGVEPSQDAGHAQNEAGASGNTDAGLSQADAGNISSGGSGNVDAGGTDGDSRGPWSGEIESCGDNPVAFDLPEGWERVWWDEGCLYHANREIISHDTNLLTSVYLGVTLLSNETQTPEQLAQNDFAMESDSLWCGEDSPWYGHPSLYNDYMFGEVQTFSVTSRNIIGGCLEWFTYMWFEKNEKLYLMTLTDHLDYHLDAVAHVIETLRLSGE